MQEATPYARSPAWIERPLAAVELVRRLARAHAWWLVCCGAACGLAFALRLWWGQYSPAFPGSPRFDDSVFYYELGRSLAEGGGYSHPASGLATAQWPPGYPFFLAGLFSLFGASVTTVEVANALLAAGTSALVFGLVILLFRDRIAATAAALLYAAAPGSIFMAAVAMSETLFAFLFVLTLLLIVAVPRTQDRKHLAVLAALGIVAACAMLTREAGFVLLPIALTYWLAGEGGLRTRAHNGGLWLAAMLATMALLAVPWTVRNYVELGIVVTSSSSAAGNFLEGHHQDGTPTIDLQAEYGPLTRPGAEADLNRASWREAWQYVREHPGEELTAPFSKIRTLYQGDRAGLDWNDMYSLLPFMPGARRNALGALADAAYYALLALAAVGLLARLRSRGALLLGATVAFWTAGHAAFFADPRFHMPLIPLFAAAGGLGVSALAGSVSQAARAAAGTVRSAPWERLALATGAVLAICGGTLLLLRSAGDASPQIAPAPAAMPVAPAALLAREVCSFRNADAAAALVYGADGGASVVVGGRTWWLFGDTLFEPQSGKQIEQNSIAWSDTTDAAGCPKLTYLARNGVAVPWIEKDGSLTVWPAGAWPVDDRYFDVFIVYVYGSGPYAYWIGEVGVGRFDTLTMRTEIIERTLWDASSGFQSQVTGAQPVEVGEDGKLRVVLQTLTDQKLLARVAPESLGDAAAYEYWDGAGWSAAPARATPIWQNPAPLNPLDKVARFESGASIAYSAHLGQYIAVVNVGAGKVGARTADRLAGPWSEPVAWLDCEAIAEPRVPTCYSPWLHPHRSRDGSLFVTFTRMSSYDIVAYEVTLGAPVHEYRRDDAFRYGRTEPAEPGWRDDGIAFSASESAAPGLAPVYAWTRDVETMYARTSPGDGYLRGDIAFYAVDAPPAEGGVMTYRPVYDWSDGRRHVLSPIPEGLEAYGFARGEAAFYAP